MSEAKPVNGKRQKQLTTPVLSGRVLPQALDAEVALLGCAMLAPKEVIALMISHGMGRECFYVAAHKTIIGIVYELVSAGKPVDFTMVAETLNARKQLDEVGGASFVSHCFTFVPTAANAKYYMELVMEAHVLREIITESFWIASQCYEGTQEVGALVGDFTKAAARIARIGHRANKRTTAELVMKVINDRQRLADAPREVSGLTTFWPRLDAKTGGLLRSNLRLVCAPPNTGKTIFALNELECVAIHHGMPSLIVESEITAEKTIHCLAASLAWVDIDRVRDNKLTMEEEAKWAEAMQKIATPNITIETGRHTRHELCSIIRAWKAHNQAGRYVAVDNLQIIKHREREGTTEAEELKKDAYALKDVANELDITITLLSQQTGETAKGSRGPEEASDITILLREDEMLVKKSRSGGKGFHNPITIDPDHQRIIEREDTEEEPPKKRKKSV